MSTTLLAAWMLACVTACGGDDHGHDHDGDAFNAFGGVSKAVCVLAPTDGTELTGVAGTVSFTQTKSGVLIQAEVTGLTPGAKHALSIAQWGDISANDGSATGGRYDPVGIEMHGLPNVHSHGDVVHAMVVGQAGGLGNLEADDAGNASYSLTYENLSLTAGNALLGRAVVVHLNEDTGEQPDGNAGPAVAQGVIGVADPE